MMRIFARHFAPSRYPQLHAAFGLLVRLYLGSVFILASLHKILSPAVFALEIASYEIVPLGAINLAAITLPYVELAAGLLLILGWRTRAAMLLVAFMLSIFLVALGLAMHQGLHIACGCFAAQPDSQERIGWPTVRRDLAWLALAIYNLAYDQHPLGLDRLRRRSRHIAERSTSAR